MNHRIALASGSGGAGVTSLAIALGASFTDLGLDTTVVDANLRTPHVGLHLGTSQLPVALQDALDREELLQESIYHHVPSGLKVVPAHHSARHAESVNPENYQIMRRILEKMPGHVTLLDCPAGPNPETEAAISVAEQLILVTKPELPAVIDTLKVARNAQKNGKTIRGVIVNQSGKHKHELSAENVRQLLDMPVLAEIPYDNAVPEALALHHPHTYSHPESKASEAVHKLAMDLLN